MKHIFLIIALFTAMAGIGWAQQHCDLDQGCHWELEIGTKGTYTQYEFKIGPDNQNLQVVPIPMQEPTTTIDEGSQAGITQKISGTVVVHETTIRLFDDAGNLIGTPQTLKQESGGSPILQTFVYQICATSPTEPDICGAEKALTAQ